MREFFGECVIKTCNKWLSVAPQCNSVCFIRVLPITHNMVSRINDKSVGWQFFAVRERFSKIVRTAHDKCKMSGFLLATFEYCV